MTYQPDYKTRADGSIDYGHYLQRSAVLRGEEFRAVARLVRGMLAALLRRPSGAEPTAAPSADVRRHPVGRPVARKAVPERHRVVEPPQNAPRTVRLKSPRVRQPQVSISYLAPSYRQAELNDAYALQVLSEVIGGGATARLYSRLVVEQGIAGSAGAGYNPIAYDYATFGFYIAPRPGGDVEALEAALRKEIAELLENGVSADEVAAAKKRLVAGAVFARDSLSTAPQVIGAMLTSGGSLEQVEAWPERISEVTAEDVNRALKGVLREEQSVTSYLLPEPTS